MFNPLSPYLSIISFAVDPLLKLGFAALLIGVAMVALGYDPIGLAVGWAEMSIRSFIPGI